MAHGAHRRGRTRIIETAAQEKNVSGCALVSGAKERVMPTIIPEPYADLMTHEKKAFAFLATVRRDGRPQVTPVWFEWDDTHLRINTARGRIKDRIMAENPQVALAIPDPANPYRYIQIQGRVVSSTEEGARAHIDTLAEKYLGQRSYPYYQGETRVIYTIEPVRVQAQG
jgi:PPOX class probable F420-dependent enzyme